MTIKELEKGYLKTEDNNYLIINTSLKNFPGGRLDQNLPKDKWHVIKLRLFMSHYRDWSDKFVAGSFTTEEEAKQFLIENIEKLNEEYTKKKSNFQDLIKEAIKEKETKKKATKAAPKAKAATKLTKNSAGDKVNLNTATVDQLCQLPKIGKAKAEAIVAKRPFTKVEDIKKVKGIGEKLFEAMEEFVAV